MSDAYNVDGVVVVFSPAAVSFDVRHESITRIEITIVRGLVDAPEASGAGRVGDLIRRADGAAPGRCSHKKSKGDGQ